MVTILSFIKLSHGRNGKQLLLGHLVLNLLDLVGHLHDLGANILRWNIFMIIARWHLLLLLWYNFFLLKRIHWLRRRKIQIGMNILGLKRCLLMILNFLAPSLLTLLNTES